MRGVPATAIGVVLAASALLAPALVSGVATAAPRTVTGASTGDWHLTRASAPARTLVSDGDGRLLATFTDGARTVVVAGPRRVLAEPGTTSATVTTTAYVHLLPAPFAGTVDQAWLRYRLGDTRPDLLAAAMTHATGAEADASYGPLVDGTRQEGSDWNDYLGVDATYDGVLDRPETAQRGAMDCSGFVRMVFGHRGGFPMTLTPDGLGIPRRAVQMATSAPGAVIVPDRGARAKVPASLQAGDLVLFDVATDDGADVDHVGIYLGKDSSGRHRFLSSRKKADGPTMGDVGGRSVLDGTGLYAKGFRSSRRL